VRRFVVGGDQDGYALSHDRFGDYLRNGPLQQVVGTYRDRLLAWCERWREHPASSEYALRYYLTHLADAADRAGGDERRRRVSQLAEAIGDEEFHRRHLDVIGDVPALERDIDTALGHVARAAPVQMEAIVRSVLVLEAFRHDRLEPGAVYDLAAAGRIEDAEKRLGLFAVEDQWAFVARLVIAWVAAEVAPGDAAGLLGRLAADVPPWDPIPLMAQRVHRWLAGERGDETGLSLPYRSGLPQAPSEEEVAAVVTRMGGVSDLLGDEAVEQLGRPTPGESDEARPYIAERDSPALAAFAAAHPDPGARLLSDYIQIHSANAYTEYRNRSLWAILGATSAHPDPAASRDLARQLVSAALAAAPLAFREGLRVTVAALRAAAGEPGAIERFESLEQEAIDAIARLDDRRWKSDSWGNHCRRMAVLAEAEALALGRHDRAASLLATARTLPPGFAGFQSSASLTLAEAARICRADDGTAGLADVESALTAAHNVQEPILCAQRTARVNAMLDAWWPAPIADARIVLDRFTTDPLAAEFAPLHIVGDRYERRLVAQERLSLPYDMYSARTLSQIADVFHVPCAALQALNPNPDGRVRIRDPHFAAILAARFAAEALAHPAIPDEQRPALIAGLIPAAAGSPTPVHTILSRLLLALRPDPRELERLAALAPAGWLDEPAAGATKLRGPA
jgi:hypothetical protein